MLWFIQQIGLQIILHGEWIHRCAFKTPSMQTETYTQVLSNSSNLILRLKLYNFHSHTISIFRACPLGKKLYPQLLNNCYLPKVIWNVAFRTLNWVAFQLAIFRSKCMKLPYLFHTSHHRTLTYNLNRNSKYQQSLFHFAFQFICLWDLMIDTESRAKEEICTDKLKRIQSDPNELFPVCSE